MTLSTSANTAAPIIQLDNVGVCYQRSSRNTRSLKEFVAQWIRRPWQMTNDQKPFWALSNLSLEVPVGACLGIIGANGAGKSTLLKVIARVLIPTTGRVRLWGVVAPLLELGAGFDGELTGRENVFLNGALLGYSKAHLARRLDEIVAFAGIEDALDAPVRTYSSGMVARLGFAIASDQQPAVLIVDEVLGVGDSDFQRRSSERILGYYKTGTTVLVVSHSLGVIEQLCPTAIWLDQGHLQIEGETAKVLQAYRKQHHQQIITALHEDSQNSLLTDTNRYGSGVLQITKVVICNQALNPQQVFASEETVCVLIDFYAFELLKEVNFGIAIHTNAGVHLSGPNTKQAEYHIPALQGAGQLCFEIPKLPLLDGMYFVSVAAVNNTDTEVYDYHDRVYRFQVFNEVEPKERFGLLMLHGKWSLR